MGREMDGKEVNVLPTLAVFIFCGRRTVGAGSVGRSCKCYGRRVTAEGAPP